MNDGLLMTENGFYDGLFSNFSLLNRMWEPGGILVDQVHGNVSEEFYSEDRALQLMQIGNRNSSKRAAKELTCVVARKIQIQGLQTKLLVNLTPKSYQLLIFYECLEGHITSRVSELFARSKWEICEDAYSSIKGIRAENVLRKRPHDPGRFSKHNQNAEQGKLVWWRFLQKVFTWDHDKEYESRKGEANEMLSLEHCSMPSTFGRYDGLHVTVSAATIMQSFLKMHKKRTDKVVYSTDLKQLEKEEPKVLALKIIQAEDKWDKGRHEQANLAIRQREKELLGARAMTIKEITQDGGLSQEKKLKTNQVLETSLYSQFELRRSLTWQHWGVPRQLYTSRVLCKMKMVNALGNMRQLTLASKKSKGRSKQTDSLVRHRWKNKVVDKDIIYAVSEFVEFTSVSLNLDEWYMLQDIYEWSSLMILHELQAARNCKNKDYVIKNTAILENNEGCAPHIKEDVLTKIRTGEQRRDRKTTCVYLCMILNGDTHEFSSLFSGGDERPSKKLLILNMIPLFNEVYHLQRPPELGRDKMQDQVSHFSYDP